MNFVELTIANSNFVNAVFALDNQIHSKKKKALSTKGLMRLSFAHFCEWFFKNRPKRVSLKSSKYKLHWTLNPQESHQTTARWHWFNIYNGVMAPSFWWLRKWAWRWDPPSPTGLFPLASEAHCGFTSLHKYVITILGCSSIRPGRAWIKKILIKKLLLPRFNQR